MKVSCVWVVWLADTLWPSDVVAKATMYFKRLGVPPSSVGGSQLIVTWYGPMEGKARFSGLPGGTVWGGGVTERYNGKELN